MLRLRCVPDSLSFSFDHHSHHCRFPFLSTTISVCTFPLSLPFPFSLLSFLTHFSFHPLRFSSISLPVRLLPHTFPTFSTLPFSSISCLFTSLFLLLFASFLVPFLSHTVPYPLNSFPAHSLHHCFIPRANPSFIPPNNRNQQAPRHSPTSSRSAARRRRTIEKSRHTSRRTRAPSTSSLRMIGRR